MNLPEKGQPKQTFIIDSKLPDSIPRIPEAVIKRFPEMQQWQSQLDTWWLTVKRNVERANEQVASKLNKEN